MYTIYADDELIYTPDVGELCLYNIILTLEDNSAGTLTFNIVSSHPAFDSLKKLATMIQVADNSRIIWKGRIISDNEDINHIKTIQCEGKLAFLNDSIFPEFDFSGAPDLLFRQIIENHNAQVGERQRFLLGNVTVKDKNDYIVRSSENALKTWKAVKEKCFQSTLGGHVQVRYEAEGDYLDWLEDYQEISEQPISFGKNIIDLLVNTSAEETYTAIRPQGAEIDGKRITIVDVNDGKDYLVDEEKAAEYGVIYADPEESTWDDVTLPENLIRKARERLKSGIVLKKTIEVRAIDLNLTDKQMDALKVCSYVRVVSKLHGIEAWYLLSKAELYIDAPESTKYTLGAVKMALTDTNKQAKSVFEKVMNMSIPTKVGQLKNDKSYTTQAEVEEIIKESGVTAPVIGVYEESDNTYILTIQTAEGSFETPNLMGRQGEPGDIGYSAYDLAAQSGYEGTIEEWLASLKGEPGDIGYSAYDLAVQNGFEGTVEEWLVSLKGTPGDGGQSAYDLAVQNGYEGTVEEWLVSLKGAPGKDATVKIENIVLDSVDGIEENQEPGKLVDALVIKEVFQSVSEGKSMIASAITDKGVETDAGDTLAVMAGNIGKIEAGGSGGNGDCPITSPYEFSLNWVRFSVSSGGSLDQKIYFPVQKLKRFVIKKLYLYMQRVSSNNGVMLFFQICGIKKGSTAVTNVIQRSVSVSRTTSTSTGANFTDYEIDLSEWEEINYCSIFKSTASGTVVYAEATLNFIAELYF